MKEDWRFFVTEIFFNHIFVQEEEEIFFGQSKEREYYFIKSGLLK